jgi:pyruvate, orthophosphate dikinase
MAIKYVYFFEEGKRDMKSLLGGKGANLAEMTNIGLPVPPGFTITTECCKAYYNDNKVISDSAVEEVKEAMKKLEQKTLKGFGDIDNPLLVSVRSGSVFSMPGMMDTILNLGLNDETVEGLKKSTQNGRFAYDSYRRFIQMFGDVVLGIEKYKFDMVFNKIKEDAGIQLDYQLTEESLRMIIEDYKKIIARESGKPFPQDPITQLIMAIRAVFDSWNNTKAVIYRKINNIPSDLGTAVNIQSMVFGNMGQDCGTGVAFTRNPSNGAKGIFGEFLVNAQGEDVVAGIRTPRPISELQEAMPEVYDRFIDIAGILEKHYKDMQDLEFTIEKGNLYMLQTRNGKRTAMSAINIAVDMVNEGLITKEEAVMRVEPEQLDQLLHPTFEPKALKNARVLAKGLPASPGAASGKVYFSPEDVVKAVNDGEKAILVRQETSPEDIEGMYASNGILTSTGGMTSHAAVVARGMGKCCIAGCSQIFVDEHNKQIIMDDITISQGEILSLDGNTGTVYVGEIDTVQNAFSQNYYTLMGWADDIRTLKVRTNADTPRDAKAAVDFGAEGIGLCRTEHMFFDEDRIPVVREMIVSETLEQRQKALEKLLPMQRKDFEGLFETMEQRPVTIRLLDPPLHEFLPSQEEDIKNLAIEIGMSYEDLSQRIHGLREVNPMLGHRGCRLAVTYPEIAVMQTRAIMEAAINVSRSKGVNIHPEIMIPLIGDVKELNYVKSIVEHTAKQVITHEEYQINYIIGTMIEVPRAALTADEIASQAEFFSFGTNDLTQMTFGFSRDDAGKFLKEYVDKGIFEKDPFFTIDKKGVGKLMEMAIDLALKVRPDIKLGICGEHGGEPKSVEFCHNIGLHYVSCSPYRVPIARLAAAQAAIKSKEQSK